MTDLDLGRTHLSGLDSWPPDPRVAAHLAVFARLIKQRFQGGTLVDAGCGDGSLARIIAEENPQLHIVGMDLQEHPLWHFPKPSNLQFLVGSLESIPVKPEAFDYAVTKDVLHHMPQPAHTLQQIRKLARSSVLVIEANRYNPLSYIWMVRIAKHEHFSRRRLRSIIGVPAEMHSLETHVWPARLSRAGNAFEWVMNKVKLFSLLANYNYVFIGADSRSATKRNIG